MIYNFWYTSFYIFRFRYWKRKGFKSSVILPFFDFSMTFRLWMNSWRAGFACFIFFLWVESFLFREIQNGDIKLCNALLISNYVNKKHTTNERKLTFRLISCMIQYLICIYLNFYLSFFFLFKRKIIIFFYYKLNNKI